MNTYETIILLFGLTVGIVTLFFGVKEYIKKEMRNN